VGGTAPIQVDIRVIAATNRDLTQAVKSGAFREDLFFRLNVIPIALPPLRERRADIPRLAEFFLEHHRRKLKRPGLSLSASALDALQRYHWPGNIRELENLLERAVVLSAGDELQPEELALPAPEPAEAERAGSAPYQARLDAAEKAMLEQALREHAGNRRAAARAMGIALSTLYAKLKKYSLT
jgi:two-component system response regulator HydG